MTPKQINQLKKLRNKLFEAMLFDTNPEHWVGFGKKVNELTKPEKDEANWCRRQASNSILLWEKVDKMIKQVSEPEFKQLTLNDIDLDISSFEQEANELLTQLKNKEQDDS